MADKVDPQVVDALTIGNTKTVAEAASFAMGTMFQHQVNHARRLDALAEAHLGKVLNTFSSVDVTEAVATSKMLKGESDSSIASLLSQLVAGQVGTKIGQSTPGDSSLELAKLNATVSSLQATMGALAAMLQQTVKVAQSTPPESGK